VPVRTSAPVGGGASKASEAARLRNGALSFPPLTLTMPSF
jgi:hypothetical protein